MDGWTGVGGNGHSDGFVGDRGRGGEPVTHRVGCGTSEKWDMPHLRAVSTFMKGFFQT